MLHCFFGSDPALHKPDDLEGSGYRAFLRSEDLIQPGKARGLHPLAVDFYVAGTAGPRGQTPGFVYPDAPEPFIDSYVFRCF